MGCMRYKNRTDKPRQVAWSQFSIKMVGVHFYNSAHNNRNWDKIYDNLTKKIHIRNRMQFSLRGENNHKPNPLIKTMVHRSSIYYSKMYLEKNSKTNKQFPLDQ